MPRRISVSTLNASTMDILNTIRQNASMEYQNLVPEVTKESDIPKVGEVLYGYPALANQFLSTLVNRIASVRVKSATFNDDYVELKKGYLEFGETVEEVFVSIAKAREFSAEKAESRELKRTLPDVKTAFHAMNYRVQYPVTIQDEDLRTAFLTMDGVQDLIARIVDAVYTANEYDEYLLFKYLMIKAIAHGKMYPVSIGDGTDMKEAAVAFRGMSNQLGFMSTKYNISGVHTTTPRADQYIFMDAKYNAQYDVNVLASAFNMDKTTFMGKLKLIDDWTTFDNERFDVITANSDQIEPVTAEELALITHPLLRLPYTLSRRKHLQVQELLCILMALLSFLLVSLNRPLLLWQQLMELPILVRLLLLLHRLLVLRLKWTSNYYHKWVLVSPVPIY